MLSEYGAGVALANLLPSGTSRYVALLTTLPTARDGTGLVEASGGGYDRAEITAWVTVADGQVTYRANDGNLEFDELTGDVDGVLGWAVYDAASGGNLLAAGEVLTAGGSPTSWDFVSGDIPRFLDQELRIGIGDVS